MKTKRRKAKRSSFNPNQDYLERAKEAYFTQGGTISRIEIGTSPGFKNFMQSRPDPVDIEYSGY